MERQVELRILIAALAGVCLCAAAILFGALGLLSSSPANAANPVRYVSEPVITMTGDAPKNAEAAEAFETLVTQADYYAAFAHDGRGAYGWSDNYSSQSEADLSALNWCARESARCQIVARIAPREDSRIEGIVLSRTSAHAAASYADKPGNKAMALSDIGAWGMAWNYKSKQGAAARALANCADRTPAETPSGKPAGTCRIIWLD